MRRSSLTCEPLDRRVRLLQSASEESSIVRVSDLRTRPFVVLLGEPGSGKSTVLAAEADEDNATVITVRDLVTDGLSTPSQALYIDALDEYRIDGQASDKVHALAKIMARSEVQRWWLTCRAEDWRKESDIAAFRRTFRGHEITVAQLLPLTPEEAAIVLRNLGERQPQNFIATAQTLGADGFLASPLSVRLLHKAVSDGGEWPASRYELFESAIFRLAYEHNGEHKGGPRCAPPEIIEAAEISCLTLLLSGSRAIWRSHGEPPPVGADARAHLCTHELHFPRELVKDMLDSSLFRGEGEEFEPLHRTVAEYLAGRELARMVAGSPSRAVFPLTRAVAMITAADHVAPTELRGVYAWFAAHLAKSGQDDSALRLIEADAATILLYGDAASFSTPLRRAILNNLDREDPYFRASDFGGAPIGGLAGDDLAEDFVAILNGPPDGTHRLITVFDALTAGQPVETLRPLLRNIALDPARPNWHRWRAADAYLNGIPTAARELFDALANEPVSIAREELRIHLASTLGSTALSLTDIKSLLEDFESTPDDSTVGRLTQFAMMLETSPPAALFDEPLAVWLPKPEKWNHSVELEHLFDTLLAASICRTATLTAARLWRWTCNVRHGKWDSLHEASAKALRTWLDQDLRREVAFFDTIVADENDPGTPWAPCNNYITVTGRTAPSSIIYHLLERAAASASASDQKWLLAIAVELVHRDVDPATHQDAHDALSHRQDCSELVQRLTSKPEQVTNGRLSELEKTRQEDLARSREKNIQALTPIIEQLRLGKGVGHLAWAAQHYFGWTDERSGRSTKLARVVELTSPEFAQAIEAGWKYLATTEFAGVDAKMLGKADAENRAYYVERAALAGLDRLCDENKLSQVANTPIEVAVAVLRTSYFVRDTRRRCELEHWAIKRLELDPAAGVGCLVQFCEAAIDAGSEYLETLSKLTASATHGNIVVVRALNWLLASRPSMPPRMLRQALRAASVPLGPKRILSHAKAALADSSVPASSRHVWSITAFTVDPIEHGASLLKDYGTADAVAHLHDDLQNDHLVFFGAVDPGARAERNAVIVRLVGRHYPPGDDIRSANSEWVGIVRHTINSLVEDRHPNAARVLNELASDPSLAQWRQHLRHAQARRAREHRERTFKFPTAGQIHIALGGGPPLNAADLTAVVLEELYRLKRELRTSDNTPWKRYWNIDSKGHVTDPLIENQCRDHLLDRLRDRLKPYKVTAALPEARRSEETRADMLTLSGAGHNVPIEAKRHFHPDVWSASSTQLAGYARSDGADGFGIYLVFWFGNDVRRPPKRLDGQACPNSAEEFQAMLESDLPTEARGFIHIVVFDVSKRSVKPGSRNKGKTSTC